MLGTFSESGFSVVADNAVDYVAGVQAAGAGHVAANVRRVGTVLHADLARINGSVLAQTRTLDTSIQGGTESLRSVLDNGFGSLEVLSGISIAVQAVGFAVVANRLGQVRGSIDALRDENRRHAEALLDAQRSLDRRMETLVDLATRSLATQERIVETLLRSRTVEAQQLVRQGLEHLKFGHDDEALDRFLRSLEFDSTTFLAHAQLAELLAKRGEVATADAHFARALRFGDGVGDEYLAHVARRRAHFLEAQGRTAESLQAWCEVADRHGDAADQFHAAELLAVSGRGDAALVRLRHSLSSEPTLLPAAMASQRLAGLGSALVRALVDVDRERREILIGRLGAVCDLVERLDVVRDRAARCGSPSHFAAARTAERHAAELRARGGPLLERVLVTPFPESRPVESAIERLCASVEEACAAVRDEVRSAEAEEVREFDAAMSRAAATPGPPPPDLGIPVVTGVRDVAAQCMGIVFLAIGAAAVIGGVVAAVDAPGKWVGGAVAAGFGLAIGGGGAAILLRVRRERAGRRGVVADHEHAVADRARALAEAPERRASIARRIAARLQDWASATGDQEYAARLEQLTSEKGAAPSAGGSS